MSGTPIAQAEVVDRLQTRPRQIQWRWFAIGIFVFSSSVNYLDRQILAAVAPALQSEFHLSNTQYGTLVSAFSITYMLAAPLAGLFVDRLGLNVGVMVAATAWSLTSVLTGFARSFQSLFTCRMVLGAGEAAGIPSSTKATASYLSRREFSLGNAMHSVGISLGSIGAPLLVAAIVPHYGWRGAFVVCGFLGFLWVPLWFVTSRTIKVGVWPENRTSVKVRGILSDKRLWTILLVNILLMTLYSLWSNWTTIYFVRERHITALEANQYFAWIPPVFATLGGFFGGWLSWWRIGTSPHPIPVRIRICTMAAPALLITAAVPFLNSNRAVAATISASFFLCMAFLVNLHVILIDLFGPEHAAFTSAVLTSSYALMQAVISPAIGMTVDRFGFAAACISVSVLPLVGATILRSSKRLMKTLV